MSAQWFAVGCDYWIRYDEAGAPVSVVERYEGHWWTMSRDDRGFLRRVQPYIRIDDAKAAAERMTTGA